MQVAIVFDARRVLTDKRDAPALFGVIDKLLTTAGAIAIDKDGDSFWKRFYLFEFLRAFAAFADKSALFPLHFAGNMAIVDAIFFREIFVFPKFIILLNVVLGGIYLASIPFHRAGINIRPQWVKRDVAASAIVATVNNKIGHALQKCGVCFHQAVKLEAHGFVHSRHGEQ